LLSGGSPKLAFFRFALADETWRAI
jgi:hypothetical protein